MHTMLFLFLSLCIAFIKAEDLVLLAKTHTTPLSKYVNYIDCVILHFQLPLDTSYASFKFEADEIQMSLFRCKPQDITVYLKHGSPPVINPDGAKIPKGFVNYSRPNEKVEFRSLEEPGYINVTSPITGSYFATAFISYTDPKLEGITQQGLTANCDTIVTASLFVNRKPTPIIAIPDVDTDVLLKPNIFRVYKFHVFDIVDNTILFLSQINFCDDCTQLTVKVQSNKIPLNESLYDIKLTKKNYDKKTFLLRIITIEESWYYLTFYIDSKTKNDASRFLFRIQHSYYIDKDTKTKPMENVEDDGTMLYQRSLLRNDYSRYFGQYVDYKQYGLIRSSHTESFLFSFDFKTEDDFDLLPTPINITSEDLVILKFHINSGVDIGGTLQFGIAFSPQIKMDGKIKTIIDEPKEHTILACLRNKDKEIPTWPDKCVYHNEENKVALVLNDTVVNTTMFLPFPESGNWYASLKLFCGECKPCKCSASCKKQYRNCQTQCESKCANIDSCMSCIDECENAVLNSTPCKNCNCEGPCEKPSSTCSTTMLFDITSYPCVTGQCGVNGNCMYMIAEGFSYSVCMCMNKYKGWDCADDSSANSHAIIILELILLVFSNLAFLPSVYLAYKRGYFVEGVVYFATFFFSSFYHACDSGENIYTVCIARLSVLQFSDFFCGLLSIWVTIIAMAYLRSPIPSIMHISGTIILSFITTIDKTALWAFVIPFLTGTLILTVSWYRKYKASGKRFPSDYYWFRLFPAGVAVVATGLLIYGLMQTQSNYMYLHSFWHVCMAVSIMFLLPDKSFLPPE